MPITLHRVFSSQPVQAVGARAQSYKGWQSVTHRDVVCPEAGSAAIAICERMNSYPFSVNPRAKLYDGDQLVFIKVLTRRNQTIKRLNCSLQRLFERPQCASNFTRFYSRVGTNSHPYAFESLLTSEFPDVPGIGHSQISQCISVPSFCHFKRWLGTFGSIIPGRSKHSSQILAELRTIFVPVSHSKVCAFSFELAPFVRLQTLKPEYLLPDHDELQLQLLQIPPLNVRNLDRFFYTPASPPA
jgi:hypothetical protein